MGWVWPFAWGGIGAEGSRMGADEAGIGAEGWAARWRCEGEEGLAVARLLGKWLLNVRVK